MPNESDLKARIKVLEDAIRKHKDAQSHALCWENDLELYKVLGDEAKEYKLPPRCEFREKCREYYESMPGAEKKNDGW